MDIKKMGQSITDTIRNHRLPLSLIGLALAWLAAERNMKHPEKRKLQIDESITIARDPATLYKFWRNVENLSQLFSHIESVKPLEGNRSHWISRGPFNFKIEWDAEVTADVENEKVAWRSLEGSLIGTEGVILFQKAPGESGTEVKTSFSFIIPGGHVGEAFSKILGMNPAAEIREGLKHFKQLMEAGEIPVNLTRPYGTEQRGSASEYQI